MPQSDQGSGDFIFVIPATKVFDLRDKDSEIDIEIYKYENTNGLCLTTELLITKMTLSQITLPQEDIDQGYQIIRPNQTSLYCREDYVSQDFPDNPTFSSLNRIEPSN